MNANELRIGNWVIFEKEIYRFSIYDFENSNYQIVHPIPLTPEILEKCGFEKQMMWTYSISIGGDMNLVYYLGEKGWSIGNKQYSDFSNLKHLHQLQNLYYALTGQELNYQP